MDLEKLSFFKKLSFFLKQKKHPLFERLGAFFCLCIFGGQSFTLAVTRPNRNFAPPERSKPCFIRSFCVSCGRIPGRFTLVPLEVLQELRICGEHKGALFVNGLVVYLKGLGE